MSKFINPLDNIKVASPCNADWNAMIGNERQRHCGDCKLNVYNLSGMTRPEAEQLLMSSEGGRLCVRFYRRADGTILTKDCPVGWAKVKRNVRRAATAAFSLIAGLFGGIFAFNSTNFQTGAVMGDMAIERSNEKDFCDFGNRKDTEPTNVTMGTVPMMGNISMPVNETKRNSEKESVQNKKTRKQ